MALVEYKCYRGSNQKGSPDHDASDNPVCILDNARLSRCAIIRPG